ncbi:hypothetical protein ES704_01992 [subsurface metagenome]
MYFALLVAKLGSLVKVPSDNIENRMKKAKQPEQQSSFFNKVEVETKPEPEPEPKEPEDLRPVEAKTVIEPWSYPKIIHNPHSLYCPDCGGKVMLKPDGSTVCPNCTTEVLRKAG